MFKFHRRFWCLQKYSTRFVIQTFYILIYIDIKTYVQNITTFWLLKTYAQKHHDDCWKHMHKNITTIVENICTKTSRQLLKTYAQKHHNIWIVENMWTKTSLQFITWKHMHKNITTIVENIWTKTSLHLNCWTYHGGKNEPKYKTCPDKKMKKNHEERKQDVRVLTKWRWEHNPDHDGGRERGCRVENEEWQDEWLKVDKHQT